MCRVLSCGFSHTNTRYPAGTAGYIYILCIILPKCGKISPISNMTIWMKMAIFETTGKNSVLERCFLGGLVPV